MAARPPEIPCHRESWNSKTLSWASGRQPQSVFKPWQSADSSGQAAFAQGMACSEAFP